MNERIKQLAERAVEQICSKRTLSDGQIERTWHPDYFNQVFAELIIEECRDVLTDVYRGVPLECCGHFLYADEILTKHFY